MSEIAMRKIMITMPDDIVLEIEKWAKQKKTNRSKLIREFVSRCLNDLKKQELRRKLKEGYIAHAERDRQIADEFKYVDYELEKRLAR